MTTHKLRYDKESGLMLEDGLYPDHQMDEDKLIRAKKRQYYPEDCLLYQKVMVTKRRYITTTVYMITEKKFYRGAFKREVLGYMVIDENTGDMYSVHQRPDGLWDRDEEVIREGHEYSEEDIPNQRVITMVGMINADVIRIDDMYFIVLEDMAIQVYKIGGDLWRYNTVASDDEI